MSGSIPSKNAGFVNWSAVRYSPRKGLNMYSIGNEIVADADVASVFVDVRNAFSEAAREGEVSSMVVYIGAVSKAAENGSSLLVCHCAKLVGGVSSVVEGKTGMEEADDCDIASE